MSLFVTVGTTSFDLLIETLCSEKCLNLLTSSGFKEIVFQLGSGSFIPDKKSSIKITWFRYKESVKDDIKGASLVIGHGGAGTILETLLEKKPLIVVLNEQLMNNHQSELALKLAAEGYLMYTNCSSLVDSLEEYMNGKFSPVAYEPIKEDFTTVLHKVLGLK